MNHSNYAESRSLRFSVVRPATKDAYRQVNPSCYRMAWNCKCDVRGCGLHSRVLQVGFGVEGRRGEKKLGG